MSHELTEYLYVDRPRLDSYFEQVSGPVAYDKVPIWKASLGLSGPRAESTQDRPGRPYTVHEKVKHLLEHQYRHQLLESGRYTYRTDIRPQQLRLERMVARRGVIRAPGEAGDSRELALWVSPTPESPALQRLHVGPLFLLEDFVAADAPRLVRFSSWSWLLLLEETLRKAVAEDDRGSRIVVSDDYRPHSAGSPYDTLQAIGATFGPERRITALYKMRAVCDAVEDRGAMTSIAYPIAISESVGILAEYETKMANTP